MILPRLLCLPLILGLVVACSDGSGSGGLNALSSRPALELAFTESPVELSGVNATFSQDVAYGDAERHRFDIFLPDCDEPTPLVIYIHGGGFTGGDKSSPYGRSGDDIREFLQACVAYASINYTLLEIPPDELLIQAEAQGGVLTPLQDTARALQFMRYHYQSLNLDVDNVALYGGSAGAGASLWLGTHDDLADPEAEDPVLRESTRVKAVGALATQATYDILRWEEILFPITEPLAGILGGTDVVTIAQFVNATNYLFTILGVDSLDDMATAEHEAWRNNVDMLGLMDAGDAPIFVHNFETGFDNPLDMFLHHALHAIEVKERADAVGLHSVGYSDDPAWPMADPSGEGLVSFFLRHIR